MSNYPLLMSKINITTEIENYNQLYKDFYKTAKKAAEDFKGIYPNFKDLESLIKDGYAFGFEYISTIIEKVVNNLVLQLQVYDLDTAAFFYNYYSPYFDYADYFVQIAQQIEKMDTVVNLKSNMREIRKNTRGKLVGGGFGLKGAAKGIALAEAVNLTSGTMHSFANAIGNSNTRRQVNKLKDELLKSEDIKQALADALFENILMIHLAIIDFYNNHGLNTYIKPSNEQVNKCNVIFENLKKNLIKDEVNVLAEIISSNPFNKEYYTYAISKYGDQENKIEELAKKFNHNVQAYKESLIKGYLDKFNNTKKPEEIQNLLERIEITSKNLGMEKQYSEKIKALHKNARTYLGIIFTSIEEADEAKKIHKLINDKSLSLNIQGMHTINQFIEENTIEIEKEMLKSTIIKEIRNKLEMQYLNKLTTQYSTTLDDKRRLVRVLESENFSDKDTKEKALKQVTELKGEIELHDSQQVPTYKPIEYVVTNEQPSKSKKTFKFLYLIFIAVVIGGYILIVK